MDPKPHHILLIENNKQSYQLVKQTLAKSDLAGVVTWVSSGEAALSRLQTEAFDLILLNFELSGSDGLQTFQQMRAQAINVPVIFMVAAGNEPMASEAITLDVQEYLIKDVAGAYIELLPALVYKTCKQSMIALENSRLFEAEAKGRYETDILRQITAALRSDQDLTQVLDNTLLRLEQVIPYDSACVFLKQEDRLRAVTGKGFPNLEQVLGRDYPADGELIREMCAKQRPLYLPDVRADCRFENWEGFDYIRGWMGVPLIIRGEVIGYLTLDSKKVAPYGEAEAALAQAFAAQAALTIENACLFSETRRRARQLEALGQVSQDLVILQDLDTLLGQIVERAIQLFSADAGGIYLYRPERRVLEWAVAVGENLAPIGLAFAREEGLAGKIWATGAPMIIQDYQNWSGKSPQWADIPMSVMGAPIQWREEFLGVLTLRGNTADHLFSSNEADLLSQFATQAAIAVTNVHLFDETRRRTQQLAFLNELAREMTGVLEVAGLCAIVAERLHSTFGYFSVAVCTVDLAARQLVLQAVAGAYAAIFRPGEYRQALGKGIIGRAAELGQTIVANDTHAHPDFFELEGMSILSELVIPLKVDDQPIGVLNIDSDQLNAFDDSDVATLTTVADQLAVAVEKARLFTKTRRWADQLEVLHQTRLGLTSNLALQAVLEAILEGALKLSAASRNAHIFLCENEHLTFGAALWSGGRRGQPFANPRPNGLTYTVFRQGELITVSDMRTHPLFDGAPAHWAGAIVGLPLKIGQRVVGVMNVSYSKTRAWSEVELRSLHLLADQAAIAIENARLYEQARQEINERRQAEQALRQRLEFEALIASISASFINLNPNAVDDGINQALRVLGEFTQVDRSYVYLFSEDKTGMDNTHEWCAAGVEPLISNLQGIPADQFAWTMQKLERFETIHIPSVADLPSEAHAEKDILQSQQVQSLIIVPILCGGATIGFLGFDAVEEEKAWPDDFIILLKFVGEIFINALERKWGQETLAAERNLLRTVIDNLPDHVYVKNLEGRYILNNLADVQSLGASAPEEVIGNTVFDLYPAETAAKFDANDQLVFHSGQLLINEEEPLDWAGNSRWFSTTKVPLRDSHGEIIGLVGISRDITERKQTEAELNAYRQHLEALVQERTAKLVQAMAETAEARDKINAILHSVADGLIVTDLAYRVTLVNPAAEALLGNRMADMLGQEIGTGLKHAWLREVVQSALKHSIRDCEIDIKLDDPHRGQWILNARTALVDDRRGEPFGAVTIIRDVTRLREVDRLKTEFLSIAAHELRTPLTSVLGFSEIVLTRQLASERQRYFMKMINEQATHLTEIVNNLLDISRLEAGRGIELKSEQIDMGGLIREVAAPFIEAASKHKFYLEGFTKLPLVTGDALRLKQVSKNLLSNAVKYSPKGGRIVIYSQVIAGYIKFGVQDEGMGMTVEEQKHLFEKFYRATSSNTAISGTGLGLAISKLIIELHNGDIWVESQRGVGTTVYFTLPLVD